MAGSGYDSFSALGELVHPDAGKQVKIPPRASSPTAELQIKLLKSIVGDSFSKICVKMITAYESADGTADVTELEKILNNPSVKLISREMHWGSSTVTDSEGGSTSSPCLTMLVTYSINDYATMLTKIEEYASCYYGEDDLTSEASAIVSMLVNAVTALSTELSDSELKLRAKKLVADLSKLKSKDASTEEEAADKDKTDTSEEAKETSAKKKKIRNSKGKASGMFRITENIPTVREDTSAVVEDLISPTSQVTVFEVVAAAEKDMEAKDNT